MKPKLRYSYIVSVAIIVVHVLIRFQSAQASTESSLFGEGDYYKVRNVVFQFPKELDSKFEKIDAASRLNRSWNYSTREIADRCAFFTQLFILKDCKTTIAFYTDQSVDVVYTLVPFTKISSISIQKTLPSDREFKRSFVDRRWSPATQIDLSQKMDRLIQDSGIDEYSLNISSEEIENTTSILLSADTAIRFEVNRIDGPPELEKKWSGKDFDPEEFENDLQEFLEDTREKGFWATSARYQVLQTETPTKKDIQIELFARDQQYQIHFSGNAFFNNIEIRDLLFKNFSEPYRDVDLDSKTSRIREEYQKYGFYQAQVNIQTIQKELAGGLSKTDYYLSIVEGPRGPLKAVKWSGISTTIATNIESLLPVTKKWLLHFTSDRTKFITDKHIVESKNIVEQYLARNGWLDAELTQQNVEFNEDLEGYTLSFFIAPGDRYTFASKVSADSISPHIPEPPWNKGDSYDQGKVEQWKNEQSTILSKLGFLRHQLEITQRIDATSKTVDIDLEGGTGAQYRHGQVSFLGVSNRDQETLKRLIPFEKGDIARELDLTELRRRLYLLNIFSSVDVRWFYYDDGSDVVDVAVELLEKDAGELTAGLGVNSSPAEGVSANLGAEHRNLIGQLRRVQLSADVQYRYTSILERFSILEPTRAQIQINYFERWIFGSRFQGRIAVGLEKDTRESDHDFVVWRNLVGIDTDELKRQYHFLSYQISFLKKELIFNRVLNPLDFEQVGKLEYVYSINGLDSRFDPRKGWLVQGTFSAASQWLGSDFDFAVAELSTTFLWPIVKKLTLFLGVDTGVFIPLLNEDYYPRTEKFRLGGTQSIRGYSAESVGILTDIGGANGQFVNIGGLRKAAYQLELRVPLVSDFDAVLFQDGGVVQGTETQFGVESGAGLSYGGGILYHTPIGPVRFDVGSKIIDNSIDKSPVVFHFYIGALL